MEELHLYAEHPRLERCIPTVHDWGDLVRRVLAARGLERERLAYDNPAFCRQLKRRVGERRASGVAILVRHSEGSGAEQE